MDKNSDPLYSNEYGEIQYELTPAGYKRNPYVYKRPKFRLYPPGLEDRNKPKHDSVIHAILLKALGFHERLPKNPCDFSYYGRRCIVDWRIPGRKAVIRVFYKPDWGDIPVLIVHTDTVRCKVSLLHYANCSVRHTAVEALSSVIPNLAVRDWALERDLKTAAKLDNLITFNYRKHRIWQKLAESLRGRKKRFGDFTWRPVRISL